ncbi:hypothetical protein CDES_14520 (plasmid) [Corynebacterium deserti GIMN1.010]|uniref:Uncharacterized protein n=1 Tax=Corynebacterium deserti GIMN1.010 TaxID=931089 RepID=A0A0M4CFZ7_9CORY|nr:hypothetical protein CDES_14520 [Corynebacterium deserti GIMN1.010]
MLAAAVGGPWLVVTIRGAFSGIALRPGWIGRTGAQTFVHHAAGLSDLGGLVCAKFSGGEFFCLVEGLSGGLFAGWAVQEVLGFAHDFHDFHDCVLSSVFSAF